MKKFDPKKLEEQNESMAKEGLRVITLANGKVPKKDSYTEKDIEKLWIHYLYAGRHYRRLYRWCSVAGSNMSGTIGNCIY